MNGYGMILVVVLALGVSYWMVRRDFAGPATPVRVAPPSHLNLPMDVQDHVRTTAAHGHTDQAIAFLRRRADLAAPEAAAVVQALMTGRVFPTPHESLTARRKPDRQSVVDAEFLTHLRDMVVDTPANRPEAVWLLRRRIGMSDRAARRFLDGL